MARPRSKRGLEPNLYESQGLYRYKHPHTGKFHSLGNNKAKAVAAAKKLNANLMRDSDLFTQVMQADTPTFGHVLDRYIKEYYPEKKIKDSTREEMTRRLKHHKTKLGGLNISYFTVKLVADYLDQNYKGNSYTKHRGDLIDIFRWALTKGLVEANWANDTLVKPDPPKARYALPKVWYDKIHAQAAPWLQVCMDLALITLQREGDLANMRYEHIDNDVLYVIQSKTEQHGNKNSNLRIHMGDWMKEVIAKSREIDPIDCPTIIHCRPQRRVGAKEREHWGSVLPDYISKQFAKARDKVPEIAALPPKNRPSFHEIRALGGYLYTQMADHDEQFVKMLKGESVGTTPDDPFVQSLMGHTQMKMTRHYLDRHIQWVDVVADLAP